LTRGSKPQSPNRPESISFGQFGQPAGAAIAGTELVILSRAP
jgi:hypothetical protein